MTVLRQYGLQSLDCSTKIIALADAACCLCCLYSNAVTQVEFADQNTLVAASAWSDDQGLFTTRVWNVTTQQEKTEALRGSSFSLSKKGNRKQQVGRFVCTAERDLLLIHLLEAEEEGRVQAGRDLPGAFADTGARLPRRGHHARLPERPGAAAAGGGAADMSVRRFKGS